MLAHALERIVQRLERRVIEDLIIRDGKVNQKALKANHITHHDLLEELRQEGQVSKPDAVKLAYLERSGKISVVPESG